MVDLSFIHLPFYWKSIKCAFFFSKLNLGLCKFSGGFHPRRLGSLIQSLLCDCELSIQCLNGSLKKFPKAIRSIRNHRLAFASDDLVGGKLEWQLSLENTTKLEIKQ